MGHTYFTYLDAHDAIKSVAMIRSLLRHDPKNAIHALCLDDKLFNILLKMALPGVIPVRLSTIEKGDPGLAASKENRSLGEYYRALAPSALLRFLATMPAGETLAYVDSDLLFFSTPDPFFAEMDDKPVLVSGQDVSPTDASFKYNPGLMAFRNDEDGRKVLDWWRERALEQRGDPREDGRQGFLDDIGHCDRFAVANNPGIGVAPWNYTDYKLGEKDGSPTVNGAPAIFYQYYSAACLAPGCMAPCADLRYPLATDQMRLFMIPYLEALDSTLEEIRKIDPGYNDGFKTSGLTTEMCLLARKDLADAFRADYPCIVPVAGDYMACASAQYPEGLKACGPIIKAGELSWVGDYPDWASAEKVAGAYDDKAIFTAVKNAAAAVRDGKALWERDSALFQHEEWNWPLLASLFEIAAINDGKLHVLDFGGALGSTYMQHRRAFGQLKECAWHVVEQAHIVKTGQEEFSSANLRFHASIEDALKSAPINVVLLSGVLQYLPDAWAFLRKTLKTRLPIILDRTNILPDCDRITVQYVPESIYKASYPCRWLSKKRLDWIFRNAGYRLSPWWQSAVDPEGFLGVLAMPEKKKPAAANLEVNSRLRVMQVDEYYDPYLDKFYAERPALGTRSSEEQSRELLKDGFSAIHSIVPYLDGDKFEKSWFVAQALPLQRAWAMEQNIPFPVNAPNWQKEMVRQRIEEFRPDVLYLPNPVEFSGEFIASLRHKPRLVMVWKASDMPFDINLEGYDVILSGLPKLLEFAKTRGAKKGIMFKPGMPQWIADEVAGIPKTVDMCFAGSVFPFQHTRRIAMLDALSKTAAKYDLNLALHLNCDPDLATPAMRPYLRAPVFGLDMQKTLASAKIVIDDRAKHGVVMPDGSKKIDLGGDDTINMRMFEATGSGSMLLTQNISGIRKYFEPGKEIDVWDDFEDLENKTLYWLAHDKERETLTDAGKTRCLEEHGMANAAKIFSEIITSEIAGKNH